MQVRNKVLKTVTAFSGIIFLISGYTLDSESWIPVITCTISAGWLMLFGYANGVIE